MRKESGSCLVVHARLAWVSFGLLVLVLLLVPELTRADAASTPLKVYVSLPRQGDNANTSKLIEKGLNAAVRSVNGEVGGGRVRLVQLDDASGARWKTGLVRRNARQAVADPNAVAYVGELNSEATAIAKPILARAGMPMFAPVATADPLTPELESLIEAKRAPNLFRTIPNDAAQAAALVTYLKRSRAHRAVLVDDGALYGKGLADDVAREARERKVRILGRFRAHRDGKGRRALIRRIAAARPQAVIFTGSLSSGAVPLFRAFNRALPKALLFGGDALAHNSFARRVGPARSMVRLTRPAAHINPKNRRLRQLLGRRPDSVSVFAFDGMMALLRAIQHAKAWGLPTARERRAAVRDELFSGRIQKGAVSAWVVLPNGDSSNGVFDAIRLGKKRAIEPIEIALRRRQAKGPRATQKPSKARSSSIWAEISGNPNLTTFEDLEYLVRNYPADWDDFLSRVLNETKKRVREVEGLVEDLSYLDRRLRSLESSFQDRPDSFRLGQLPGFRAKSWGDAGSRDYQLAYGAAYLPGFRKVNHILDRRHVGSWTKGAIRQTRETALTQLGLESELLAMLLVIEQSLSNRYNELVSLGTI